MQEGSWSCHDGHRYLSQFCRRRQLHFSDQRSEMVESNSNHLSPMATYSLKAAPTALFLHAPLELVEALRRAEFVSYLSASSMRSAPTKAFAISDCLTVDDGSAKPTGKQPSIERNNVKPYPLRIYFEASPRSNKAITKPIPLHRYREERIAYVIFEISPCQETSFRSLRARLTLEDGLIAISLTENDRSPFDDSQHIESMLSLQLLSENGLFSSLRDILVMFWDSCRLLFASKMLDPQWRIVVSGRPAKQNYRETIPRDVFHSMTLICSESSSTRTLSDNRRCSVDWQNSRLHLGDGSTWHTVSVSINVDGEPTRKQQRQNRLEDCERRLLDLMRAHPLKPETKDRCRTLLQGEIEFLSDSEFDRAWSSAIQVAHAENPKSKWARPGAPRRALSVRRHPTGRSQS